VLKKVAEERGAPLTRIDPKDILIEKMRRDRVEFQYKEERYVVSIPGIRQADNASMAVEAVSKLKIYGQCVRCNMKKGLGNVRWPCRLEKIGPLPLILDVTHTAAGSAALASDVSFLYGNVDVVIGMLNDKDAESMAESISKFSGRVFVTPLRTERSADPEDLKKAFAAISDEVVICDNMTDAMDRAMSSRTGGRNILVTGSFHTAEEAISWLRRTYPGYWTYSQRSMTGEHIPEGRPKD
jgi:dihydrofolate synthase/folylpolyglutamate synthase